MRWSMAPNKTVHFVSIDSEAAFPLKERKSKVALTSGNGSSKTARMTVGVMNFDDL